MGAECRHVAVGNVIADYAVAVVLVTAPVAFVAGLVAWPRQACASSRLWSRLEGRATDRCSHTFEPSRSLTTRPLR